MGTQRAASARTAPDRLGVRAWPHARRSAPFANGEPFPVPPDDGTARRRAGETHWGEQGRSGRSEQINRSGGNASGSRTTVCVEGGPPACGYFGRGRMSCQVELPQGWRGYPGPRPGPPKHRRQGHPRRSGKSSHASPPRANQAGEQWGAEPPYRRGSTEAPRPDSCYEGQVHDHRYGCEGREARVRDTGGVREHESRGIRMPCWKAAIAQLKFEWAQRRPAALTQQGTESAAAGKLG